jgi:hypothetical protein
LRAKTPEVNEDFDKVRLSIVLEAAAGYLDRGKRLSMAGGFARLALSIGRQMTNLIAFARLIFNVLLSPKRRSPHPASHRPR